MLRAGGIAQVAGGVPAMCDGITQGRAGMQLSLFSRDVIAMSTAIALSHDMFDATLMLGVCDKIVPGMLIGALSFGHLPTVFVPAGPMTSGLPNNEKARVRQAYAAGKVGREELLEAESASYHSQGTCTFYGTANSNQMLMEVMGLHLPGSSLRQPRHPAARCPHRRGRGPRHCPHRLGRGVHPGGPKSSTRRPSSTRCVALLATGGSTNHTMHLVAIARAAGITLTWDDLDRPVCGGAAARPGLPQRQGRREPLPRGRRPRRSSSRSLLEAGLLHEDVLDGRRARPVALYRGGPAAGPTGPWFGGRVPEQPRHRRAAWHRRALLGRRRTADGGGNLGRAVVKTSAVRSEHRQVKAPVTVFEDQDDFLTAFSEGVFDGATTSW